MKKSKKVLAWLLVIVISVTAAGCSGGTQNTEANKENKATENGASTGAADSTELTEAKLSTHPAPHSLPTFAAILNGWFEEAGMEVTNKVYIGGPSQLEALPSGAWDLGISGVSAAITGVLNYNLSIVGFSVWDNPPHCIMARPDSAIYQAGKGHFENNPEVYGTTELYRGMKILCPVGTVAELNVVEMLKAVGLTSDDVNIVNMDIPSAIQAFKSGEGDAIATWSTYTYEAEKEGWVAISSADAVDLLMPSPFIASEKIMNENPDLVQKYIDVEIKSMQWVNDSNNAEQLADAYYEICLDEGVSTSLEDCKRAISIHHAPTIEEMRELLNVGEDGLNGFQRVIAHIMDLYMDIGVYSEEEKQKVIDAVDVSFIEKALADYAD